MSKRCKKGTTLDVVPFLLTNFFVHRPLVCVQVKDIGNITKEKPSGLPDSNFIFFVATKKTKQKKACS